MTYIYNPAEPAGNPYQPMPNVWDPHALSVVDLFTRGRCGMCVACPKYWEFDVPILDNPWAEQYAGRVRLHRQAYQFVSGVEGDRPHWDNCTWLQAVSEEDTLQLNDYHELNFELYGWQLHFVFDNGYKWQLLTPVETAGTNPVTNFRSAYDFEAEYKYFRCLGTNTFRLSTAPNDAPFVYTPDELTLSPVYA